VSFIKESISILIFVAFLAVAPLVVLPKESALLVGLSPVGLPPVGVAPVAPVAAFITDSKGFLIPKASLMLGSSILPFFTAFSNPLWYALPVFSPAFADIVFNSSRVVFQLSPIFDHWPEIAYQIVFPVSAINFHKIVSEGIKSDLMYSTMPPITPLKLSNFCQA